ncbi:hypothetical protein DNTS_030228 [Danionella cerebrum]|uniref:THD domain-containing protein n=1 Tax=Danionella cerebrum TaxID=2873325 RepID=A0A553Q8E8_9TELE|nr:hypothetical protein DNTS_030228 [Danionella translucida]TRY86187.1 hypothetical protein DNTS_030228 [Danionella translucida]
MTEGSENEAERPPQVTEQPLPVSQSGGHSRGLYLLVSLALLGVLIQTGLIYHLYCRLQVETSSFHSSARRFHEAVPGWKPGVESRRAAFLQRSGPAGTNGILCWSHRSFPGFLQGLLYQNCSLVFQQDGIYFLFSKLTLVERGRFFKHTVKLRMEKHNWKPVEIMQSSRILRCSGADGDHDLTSSFLGGVFRLSAGESVFVEVNNGSLVHQQSGENFLGAFMI